MFSSSQCARGIVSDLRNCWQWLLLSVVLIIVDQTSKQAVFHYLLPYDPMPMGDYLNISLAYNPGAAFSLFRDANGWQNYLFGGIAISAIALLTRWLVNLPREDRLQALAYSFIIAGAAGNLLDRWRLGFVIDFIDFHYKSWHFATFNFADTVIFFGAAFLILKLFRSSKS
jgi:signal peptidase II